MSQPRRHFTPEQKVAPLRPHLLEKKPVSDLCQEHHLSVTLFYLWQKQFFDNGTVAFERSVAKHFFANQSLAHGSLVTRYSVAFRWISTRARSAACVNS